MAARAPIVIAYDGSQAAQAAVRRAGELFPGRSALVLTAWDPRLGEAMTTTPDPTGLGSPVPYDPELARKLDREVEHNAQQIAASGAELARGVGLNAGELVVEDVSHPADAILAAAAEHRAAAIVVGSRGHGRLRSRLLGSTSNSVLRGAGELPVVIVHAPTNAEPHDG
jgi:nucleotide-binding universal stress UspA family protein